MNSKSDATGNSGANFCYATFVVDPPWPYNIRGPASSKEHRPNSHGAATSSRERYGAMTIEELKNMRIEDHATENAHMYLWATNSFLVEAHELMEAWGFAYKTTITWGKVKADGTPSMKTGFYFRGATEHCLFGVRGKLKLAGPAEPTLILTKRLPHSVKPSEFYEMVERQSPSPRLDVFSRCDRDGWDAFGNEVDSDVELVA